MSDQVLDFLDIRRFNYLRTAAVAPKVYRANPGKNAEEHLKWIKNEYTRGGQLIVFPELSLTGYSIQDLHHQKLIHKKVDQAIAWLLQQTSDINAMIVFGAPLVVDGRLFNAQYWILRGLVLGIIVKSYPPNNGEFTERRWFRPARELTQNEIYKFGQTIPVGNDLLFASLENDKLVCSGDVCEDRWVPVPWSSIAAMHGAKVQASSNASNFQTGKRDWRVHLAKRSGDDFTAFVMAGAGFGESTTGLYFEGDCIIAQLGTIVARDIQGLNIEGSSIIADIDLEMIETDRMKVNSWSENAADICAKFPMRRIYFEGTLGVESRIVYSSSILHDFDPEPFVPKTDDEFEAVHNARLMGLVNRLFHLPVSQRRIYLGLSGGVDSTDVLMLAVRAIDLFGDQLGMTRQDIVGVTMPGFGTSDETFDYATALGREVGITFHECSIKDVAEAMFEIAGESNLVARIRSNPDLLKNPKIKALFGNGQAWLRIFVLLVKSAAKGGFVLGTSCATEIFIGWTTLFGDSASHYNPNGGMGKTAVRAELKWIAGMIAKDMPELSLLLIAIASSASSPELLMAQNGKAVEKSEVLNGPDSMRDFFVYWKLRYAMEPHKIYRMALSTYGTAYSPEQIYQWLFNFVQRIYTNWYKANSQSVDTIKIGSVAPGAHDFTKIPSDIEPTLWLEDLRENVPNELKPVGLVEK